MDDDFFDRHGPEGFKVAMQFWEGETWAEAVEETARVLGVPTSDVVAVPGHYHFEFDDDLEQISFEFRPFGWMTFSRITARRSDMTDDEKPPFMAHAEEVLKEWREAMTEAERDEVLDDLARSNPDKLASAVYWLGVLNADDVPDCVRLFISLRRAIRARLEREGLR